MMWSSISSLVYHFYGIVKLSRAQDRQIRWEDLITLSHLFVKVEMPPLCTVSDTELPVQHLAGILTSRRICHIAIQCNLQTMSSHRASTMQVLSTASPGIHWRTLLRSPTHEVYLVNIGVQFAETSCPRLIVLQMFGYILLVVHYYSSRLYFIQI